MSNEEHNEKLWDRLTYWRERLENREDYPTLESLEHSWRYGHQQDIDDGWYKRDDQPSDNPISAVMFFIEMGFYPPPEYMLTMLDCFEAYKRGAGDLEELFFGKPKQRSGNYAERKAKRLRDFRISWEFSRLLKNGISRKEAAERIVNDLELDIDADSVLRMLRGFNGFGTAQKPEK
ncbi:hypothetical protein G4Y73_06405 [Wenzhouxiangella sp. XN201]|uniref:hypothetical protein n=1 Tax=Wenzhouxiangella sp. XN201 TaxID=2710755 RepID=UPI0013CA05D9|nr:hypothetical protein [Wenzhouxiangella sp. XN201]NEZ03779.1 hypothetical protein [Wenzhouxiangella sp. XN201]